MSSFPLDGVMGEETWKNINGQTLGIGSTLVLLNRFCFFLSKLNVSENESRACVARENTKV